MDKQIQKLRKLIKKHLHQSKEELSECLGAPLKKSDPYIWFYSKRKWIMVREEAAFTFEHDSVVDISITWYILGMESLNVFYYENAIPEYKVRSNIFL